MCSSDLAATSFVPPPLDLVKVSSSGEKILSGACGRPADELVDANLSAMVTLVEEVIDRATDSVIQDTAERVMAEEMEVAEQGEQQRSDNVIGPLQQPSIVATDRSCDQGDDDGVDGRSIDLPKDAGNLSPRMVIVPEPSSASLIVGLNIEHPGAAGKGHKTTTGRGARVLIPSDRQLRSATNAQTSLHYLHHD